MRLRLVNTLSLLGFVACGSSDRHEPKNRYTNTEAGYSVGQPDGWSTSTDRGSTRFAPSSGRQTIVVRSTSKPRELTEGSPATADGIVGSTEMVLRHMPHAKVGDAKELSGTELPATRFAMTFVPPGEKSAYQRVHIVLLGEHHVFHIMQTAPQGEVLDEEALREMVSTLTEEG